jgi:NAD(P)-dependent dehydrogenase (short-subunit alcohol dehydrogenase family)
MRRRPDLTSMVAVVTGAGSGIGRATALAFAQRGHSVAVLDIDSAAADDTAASCVALGVGAKAFACDVTDADAVVAVAAEVEAQLGPVGVLVNNAGVGMTGRFLDTTAEDWAWIRSVNLDGIVNCCHAFVPAMAARRAGHVVNVSSGLAYTPRATEPAYVTTKAAVLALSQCVGADWRRLGIGVSAVCHGVINTPIAGNTRYIGEEGNEARRQRAQRLFSRGHAPELVAGAIVKAVDTNKAVIPVGAEAHAGWWFHRLAPTWAHRLLARVNV